MYKPSWLYSRKDMFIILKDNLAWVIPALILSILIPLNTGYEKPLNMVLTFISLCIARKNKIAFYLTIISFFIICLYIPIGHDFGQISFGYIASAFQTNKGEMTEFIKGVSSNALLIFSITIFFLILYVIKGKGFSQKYSLIYLLLFCIVNIKSIPARMLVSTIGYSNQYTTELKSLESQKNIPDDFTTSDIKKKYQNIVVVIGESAGRDYMSLYGYQHDTTPWLKNAPGYFFANYISAAPDTYLSLPRTMAMTNGDQTDIKNNIVALANKADFNTFWISNQGYIGEYDTLSTVIAEYAQHKTFLKKGDFDSNNADDMQLLDGLQQIVDNEHDQKVIFIHMIGSHPDSCERLNGFPVNFNVKNNKEINCYLASIQKLDSFIERAVSILKNKGESYSLVYFSDHGLTVRQTSRHLILGQDVQYILFGKDSRSVLHGRESKQNYNVPFFIIASDILTHNTYYNYLSANNFMAIFEWLAGFNSNKIKPLSPIEHSDENVSIYDGEASIPYNSLKDNEIIK